MFAIEGAEPVVGDGDTMSITAETEDDLCRAAEGGLGINNPISRGASLKSYRWQRHCRGLYQTPMAA
jgi:hypothetical protein